MAARSLHEPTRTPSRGRSIRCSVAPWRPSTDFSGPSRCSSTVDSSRWPGHASAPCSSACSRMRTPSCRISRLVDELWGDDPPVSVASTSSRATSRSSARRSAGTRSRRAARATWLGSAAEALDLIRFERSAHPGRLALADGRFEDASARARATRSRSGAARRSRISSTSLRWRRSRHASRSCTSSRSSDGSRPTSRAGGTPRSSPEAGDLARAHPLRERPALAPHGRALPERPPGRGTRVIPRARTRLAEELGLEPGPALQELERADPAPGPARLQSASGARDTQATAGRRYDRRCRARPRARSSRSRELGAPLAEPSLRASSVPLRTVADAGELDAVQHVAAAPSSHALLEAASRARGRRSRRSFPGADLGRVATEQDADLVLVDAPDQLLEDGRVVGLLGHAPCDVGDRRRLHRRTRWTSSCRSAEESTTGPPWSWGAWLARSVRRHAPSLAWRARRARRDGTRAGCWPAPRWRCNGRSASPPSLCLVEPEPAALVAAAAGAAVVCVGLPDRWQRDGLGPTRTALAARADGADDPRPPWRPPRWPRPARSRHALHLDDRRLTSGPTGRRALRARGRDGRR